MNRPTNTKLITSSLCRSVGRACRPLRCAPGAHRGCQPPYIGGLARAPRRGVGTLARGLAPGLARFACLYVSPPPGASGQPKYLRSHPSWNASPTAGRHPPMAWTLIRDIARMLSPDRPIVLLARLAGCPRPTAKSWATGHRRPPIFLLRLLRDMAEAQARNAGSLGELDYEIRQREYEPKHRTGFNIVRERDGPGSVPRDGRNRLGRPKKIRTTPPEKARQPLTSNILAPPRFSNVASPVLLS
jgi:hypothetical protein